LVHDAEVLLAEQVTAIDADVEVATRVPVLMRIEELLRRREAATTAERIREEPERQAVRRVDAVGQCEDGLTRALGRPVRLVIVVELVDARLDHGRRLVPSERVLAGLEVDAGEERIGGASGRADRVELVRER